MCAGRQGAAVFAKKSGKQVTFNLPPTTTTTTSESNDSTSRVTADDSAQSITRHEGTFVYIRAGKT